MSEYNYVEGGIIVIFKDGVSNKTAEDFVKNLGLSVIKRYSDDQRTFLIRTPLGKERMYVEEIFRNSKLVSASDLNYKRRLVKPIK